MRREPVVAAVPRQERHPAAGDLADEHGLARVAVRGLDLHLFVGGEKLVKAGTADDPDVRDRSHGRQATFSPALPEEDEDDEDDDEDAGLSPVFLLSPSPAFLSPLELEESPEVDDEDVAGVADDPLRLSVR
jgi:hypothetical protein